MHSLTISSAPFHPLSAPNHPISFPGRLPNPPFRTPQLGLFAGSGIRRYPLHPQGIIPNSLCNKRPKKAQFFTPSPFFRNSLPSAISAPAAANRRSERLHFGGERNHNAALSAADLRPSRLPGQGRPSPRSYPIHPRSIPAAPQANNNLTILGKRGSCNYKWSYSGMFFYSYFFAPMKARSVSTEDSSSFVPTARFFVRFPPTSIYSSTDSPGYGFVIAKNIPKIACSRPSRAREKKRETTTS